MRWCLQCCCEQPTLLLPTRQESGASRPHQHLHCPLVFHVRHSAVWTSRAAISSLMHSVIGSSRAGSAAGCCVSSKACLRLLPALLRLLGNRGHGASEGPRTHVPPCTLGMDAGMKVGSKHSLGQSPSRRLQFVSSLESLSLPSTTKMSVYFILH